MYQETVERPRAKNSVASKSTAVIRDGVAGNARLTGAVAAALLVLLAAEGATIPFIGQLLGEHIYIGVLLIPPVLLKLASTGYRFVRYYTGKAPYVRKGPPQTFMRLLAPGVVLTTLALFGTGVALIIAGPPSKTLIFAHKLSFFAWVALMTLHVLGHVLEIPALAFPDWAKRDSGAASLAGRRSRVAALVLALAAGAVLGVGALALAGPWT